MELEQPEMMIKCCKLSLLEHTV